MSYYVGDYYVGDPGFFGSLGRFAKGVIGAGIRSIPGVGALVAGVGSIAKSPKLVRLGAKFPALGEGGLRPGLTFEESMGATASGRAVLAEMDRPRALAPMPGGAVPQLMPPTGLMRPGPCIRMSPRGRRIRINCRTGKAVRHMRVTNPKALRRAIRRANGFAKLARKVLHFTSPRAPRGRAVFRKRRKK